MVRLVISHDRQKDTCFTAINPARFHRGLLDAAMEHVWNYRTGDAGFRGVRFRSRRRANPSSNALIGFMAADARIQNADGLKHGIDGRHGIRPAQPIGGIRQGFAVVGIAVFFGVERIAHSSSTMAGSRNHWNRSWWMTSWRDSSWAFSWASMARPIAAMRLRARCPPGKPAPVAFAMSERPEIQRARHARRKSPFSPARRACLRAIPMAKMAICFGGLGARPPGPCPRGPRRR